MTWKNELVHLSVHAWITVAVCSQDVPKFLWKVSRWSRKLQRRFWWESGLIELLIWTLLICTFLWHMTLGHSALNAKNSLCIYIHIVIFLVYIVICYIIIFFFNPMHHHRHNKFLVCVKSYLAIKLILILILLFWLSYSELFWVSCRLQTSSLRCLWGKLRNINPFIWKLI